MKRETHSPERDMLLRKTDEWEKALERRQLIGVALTTFFASLLGCCLFVAVWLISVFYG